MPDGLVDLGEVRGAYGIRGWCRVAPFDADAVVLRHARIWWAGRGPQRQRIEVTAVRRQGASLVAKWVGVDSPEQAKACAGMVVAVARQDFPPAGPGEHYWVDLVGCKVVNRGGDVLGSVQSLVNHGAQDLLVVTRASEAPLLVPMVDRYVDEVDLQARVIRVDWQVDW